MSRVFWDTMLLVYLLDGNREFGDTARSLVRRSRRRGDLLLTSWLALGEVLAGVPEESAQFEKTSAALRGLGFQFLQFDQDCVLPFRRLRREFGLRGPDAMHLACAAAGGVDIFLTGDKQLLKKNLHIAGVHFIADFMTAPL